MKLKKEDLGKVYLDYLEDSKVYFRYDPIDMPGYMFLHESVLNGYGLCPYIKIDMQEADISDTTRGQRRQWLESQDDKGELYYNLVDNIVKGQALDQISGELCTMEKEIDALVVKSLNEQQQAEYRTCIGILDDYVATAVKTKKVKEKYKTFVNKLSELCRILPLHVYLGAKYDLQILINDPRESSSDILVDMYVIDSYNTLIESYVKAKEKYEQKKRYTTNTINNLKNELYLYMTNQKNFYLKSKPRMTVQSGKYYKRWILLTEEERHERFRSFSEYYIDKYMVEECILDVGLRDQTVDHLYNLLVEGYTSKKMIYRDYTWNSSKGVIEHVKILRYNRETGEFWLNFTKAQAKSVNKRKSSSKSIFTKESEKVINEQILYYIIKQANVEGTSVQSDTDDHTETKDLLKEVLEHIKQKLKVKKLSQEDKMKIVEKFNEINQVVKRNSVQTQAQSV
ncbi:hypothetical protein EB118_10480 [bacterium]|nr:hypothetical protein [bacterium]NDD83491.1 hypothetical protein [bacterium]NDG30482.1 hypothetical protein [bacterium]